MERRLSQLKGIPVKSNLFKFASGGKCFFFRVGVPADEQETLRLFQGSEVNLFKYPRLMQEVEGGMIMYLVSVCLPHAAFLAPTLIFPSFFFFF